MLNKLFRLFGARFPITTYGASFDEPRTQAANVAGRIWMRDGLRYPAAVWAQECYEAEKKLIPGYGWLHVFSPAVRRRLEIIGHEVETQAAVRLYGVDEHDYRQTEATDMIGYYSEFRDFHAHGLARAMETVAPQAKAWVEKNESRIREHL